MATLTAPSTFEEIRPETDCNFPHELLEGSKTVLALYAAGFYGINDCFWVAEAGLTATCVDVDAQKLAEMEAVYPDGWEWVVDDVFQFAKDAAAQPLRWDVVIADPYTHDFDRAADSVRLWCSLARRAVILGSGPNTVVRPPPDWKITGGVRRSDFAGGVYWVTLEPR